MSPTNSVCGVLGHQFFRLHDTAEAFFETALRRMQYYLLGDPHSAAPLTVLIRSNRGGGASVMIYLDLLLFSQSPQLEVEMCWWDEILFWDVFYGLFVLCLMVGWFPWRMNVEVL